jgi:hypothetical protein
MATRVSIGEGRSGIVEWWPVLQDQATGLWLGITRTGEWLHETKSGHVVFAAENKMVPLYPYLERSIERVRSQLIPKLGAISWPAEFPFEALALAALTARNQYWSGLAVGWIEQGLVTDALMAALGDVDESGWGSQEFRHRVKRLLKRAR